MLVSRYSEIPSHHGPKKVGPFAWYIWVAIGAGALIVIAIIGTFIILLLLILFTLLIFFFFFSGCDS